MLLVKLSVILVKMEVEEGSAAHKRRVHGLLQLYYGLREEGKAEQTESADPCDINGPHFDPELYLNKVNTPLLRTRGLS